MLAAYIAQTILLGATQSCLDLDVNEQTPGWGTDTATQRARLIHERAVAGDLSRYRGFTRCNRIQSLGDAVDELLDLRLRK